MNICCDSLFENENKIKNFNRSNFQNLLGTVLQKDFVNFDGKIYF